MTVQDNLLKKEGLIKTRDASLAIGVHISTIYRWIKAGKICGIKVGSFWYVQKEELAEIYSGVPIIQKRIRAL